MYKEAPREIEEKIGESDVWRKDGWSIEEQKLRLDRRLLLSKRNHKTAL